MTNVDVLIIGGGIVGLSTAYRFLQTFPDKRILLVEKEIELAKHQTGHNSGVIHSGVYYRPGSLKARLCRAGRSDLLEFCGKEGIPFHISGKVIVAQTEEEEIRLDVLHRYGRSNGARCELIGKKRLRELEPYADGEKALHVAETGVVDFRLVSERLADRIRVSGGRISLQCEVTKITEGQDEVRIETTEGEISSRFLINCAGLFSDRIARLAGNTLSLKIIPFRGEYYNLKSGARHLCRSLIYPVPDPRFPFLGVHLTRSINGDVHCGPNAVLAFAREGYQKGDVELRDAYETVTYPGLIRVARRYWKPGVEEFWRSYSKGAFVDALKRLVPEVESDDLVPAPGGVRAQAVTREGELVDDFAFTESKRMIHVINAPSPAATAALAIGQVIVEKSSQWWD